MSLEWNGRASQELAVQVEVLSLQGEVKLHMAAALELSQYSPDLEVPRQTWVHLRLSRPCRGLPSIESHSAAPFLLSHAVMRLAIGSIVFLWENINTLTWGRPMLRTA
jgi:hypothetical protein